MAVNALAPIRGSLRLIVARLALFVLAGIPGILATSQAIESGIGRNPHVTAAPDPLPLLQYGQVWQSAAKGVPVLAVGAVIAWLGLLFLTAGAVRVLDPLGPTWTTVRSAVAQHGSHLLLPYLRVALVAAVCHGIGLGILARLFSAISDHAEVAGWTLQTQAVTLNVWRAVLTLAWFAFVGVCVFWSRVILAADDRRYVRRLPAILWRLLLRNPWRGFLLHYLLSLGLVLAPLPLLWAWHRSSASATGWTVLWLVVMAGSAFVWHGRLRSALALWRSDRTRALRDRPDGPWHLTRWIARRVRRRAPSAVPEVETEVPARDGGGVAPAG